MPRIALYARVSTEDQADRGTIQTQLDFLRSYARLYGLEVYDEYCDDGVTGALRLAERARGRTLLEDARAERFSQVVVYRLDRLGRKLLVLVEAQEELQRLGVSVRSATEPFDTSTPIGTFLFQLLASLAELERTTIQDRMTDGRDRRLREGRWTTGPVPFGYALDGERRPVPSERWVGAAGLTEADVARAIFERVARGETTIRVCAWLNGLGVPAAGRYANGTPGRDGRGWRPNRIWRMVRSETYVGRYAYRSRRERIVLKLPPLVEEALRDAAVRRLAGNRSLASRPADRQYLLRGLIKCGDCGQGYVGHRARRHSGWAYYYRCAGESGHARLLLP